MKGSPYPVLRDRPIDQWKVTELRDELKRRKLTVKGLKEDLVKRLGEALRSEMESSNQEDVEEEEVENGNGDDSQQKGQDNNDDDAHAKGEDNAADETAPIAIEPLIEVTEAEGDGGVDVLVKDAEDSAVGKNIIEEVDVSGQSVEDDNVKISDQNIGQLAEELTHASPVMKDESVADDQSVEMSFSASENLSSEAALAVQESENEQIGNKNSDSTTKLDAEDIKPLNEEVKQVMSDLNSQNSQVSEVSPSLGFPVKNVSVSTDSISINEKNELKDNIIADDVKLELDVKHENEMVKTSSSPLVPDGGESRPTDVEEPQSKISLDETQKNVIDEDMSKKNSSADLGSPEKLNLDRSSGDDSMEEDTLENKQVDSTYNPVEVGVRVEKTDVTIVKEETTVNIEGDDLSTLREDAHVDDTVAIAASTEKRKLPDNQEALANNEPSKRQRRWKTESIKASEPQSSTPAIAMSTTPRGTPQAVGLKRSFSRSNSNADDDAPKERVVPPSEPATDSLKINNFLRPFTLKAVQELLGKTGTVTSFWMDHIKTHCYVTYSSVEEATETRNAVYNLKWPPNGGRPLVADFVDAQEVKSHIEAPPQLPSPVAPSAAPVAPLLPSPRQLGPRQKQMLQTNLPPPPPLTNPPPVRERLLPPPPPLEKVEPPAVTLDDLFRKTKATPRIYYLPLSEEQVKAKMEGQRRNSKQ